MKEARKTIRKLLSQASKHCGSLDQGIGYRDKEWIDVWCTLEMEFMWIAKGLHVKNEEKEVSRKTKNRAIIWPS